MDVQKFLKNTFLFESLAWEQIEQIEEFVTVKKISRGEHLFSEGQPATAFFIVVSGSVKIYKLSADGNEQIIHIQNPGDLIAEATIYEFEHYPAYCQMMEDTELIRVPKLDFIDILKKFPDISFKIMGAYSKRIKQLVTKIEELSLHNIKSRLANYILRNSRIQDNHHVCPLILTKKNLAAVLGTIPETLSRTLNFFKKEGIINEKINYIYILDRDKLNSYC